MKSIIYFFIESITKMHDKILGLNDTRELYFSDKELHFLVFGIFGMLLVFIFYPLFKYLAANGHTMVVTWIYVFTVLIVLAFAVEIGQWYSGTGIVELADVVTGLAGFLAMFAIFLIIRGVYNAMIDKFSSRRRKRY